MYRLLVVCLGFSFGGLLRLIVSLAVSIVFFHEVVSILGFSYS